LYDVGMQLDRSRAALRRATRAVDDLLDADSSDVFLDRFPSVLATIAVVGSIINAETEGHRTPEFGNWWKKTQADPRFIFMRDVRNAEFKRGESRHAARHQVSLIDPVLARDFLSIFRGGKVIEEVRGQPSGEQAAGAAPASSPPGFHSIEWYFSGGLFDDLEVFTVLELYLEWLRDEVLPTAERLTR
jgi:hypothetical protein